jgi:hypothetical protein
MPGTALFGAMIVKRVATPNEASRPAAFTALEGLLGNYLPRATRPRCDT